MEGGRKISSCGFDDESRLGILCREQREYFYLLLFTSTKKEKRPEMEPIDWRDPAKARAMLKLAASTPRRGQRKYAVL